MTSTRWRHWCAAKSGKAKPADGATAQPSDRVAASPAQLKVSIIFILFM
jgi:hypothetical protein